MRASQPNSFIGNLSRSLADKNHNLLLKDRPDGPHFCLVLTYLGIVCFC